MKVLFIIKLAIIFSHSILASNSSFSNWKDQYITRASKRGLPKVFLKNILKGVEINNEVIKKDQNQILLNKSIDYSVFIEKWLRRDNKGNSQRVEQGKMLLKENFVLLDKIEKIYGVEKEVIVALWGVETFYGQILGQYNVIESLASLAYQGRRRKFFEAQLNAAFRLVYNKHVRLENFKGSWAGATGHCQFMPSNIPAYGKDYDGDGKINIWQSKADVFASIANFLKKAGWKKGKSIGSLASNTNNLKLSNKKYRTKLEYKKLGIRSLDGSRKLNGNWQRRRMSSIPFKRSPVVLRGSNYSTIMKWNRSSLFAAFNIILINEFKK